MTKVKSLASVRSALKWAGGKKKVVNEIASLLPSKGKRRLVEPFVGGGSVFLNLEFDEYLLVDMNKDLINLFNIIKNQPTEFIADAQHFFNGDHNQPEKYYDFRSQFNQSDDPYERSLLFLYLNRHGYNGLCRYNKSGGYNVPFGRYKHPYFPKEELKYFSKKAQKATFIQGDFETAFSQLDVNDVVYCLYLTYLRVNEWVSECKVPRYMMIDATHVRRMLYTFICSCKESANMQKKHGLFSTKSTKTPIYSLQLLSLTTTVIKEQHA